MTKPHINLVVLGHADAGKSTAAGHLLYKCGGVDVNSMLMRNGLEHFQYSWFINKLTAERERGITIDISKTKLETKNYIFTMIDVPGHRDYIKNTINGISIADVATVVVSSLPGEFEAGISKHGQTREHMLLGYVFGVKQLIVLVNKMDDKSVDYSWLRFDEIKKQLLEVIKPIGYPPDKVVIIPFSGKLGDNMLEKSPMLPWWQQGPTLLEALDSLKAPIRPSDKVLRVPIQEVYNIGNIGCVVTGKIACGNMKPGMQVTFAPANVTGIVKSIQMHHTQINEAKPGDCVGFNVINVCASDIRRGFVCGDSAVDPPKEVEYFVGQVVVLNHPGVIRNGYTPLIDCHSAHIACKFQEILCKVDKKNGREIEQFPESIKNGDAARVKLVPMKPMCVEMYSYYPSLGKFAVRDLRQIVAIGIIIEVSNKRPQQQNLGNVQTQK